MVVSGVRGVLLGAATSDGRSVSDSSQCVCQIGSAHADLMSWVTAPRPR